MAASTASAEAAGTIGHELALVGDVERVQAEHLAGGAHRARDRDRLLAQLDAHAGRGGDLVERRGQAAARRVAQDAHVRAGRDDRGHQPVQRLRVRGDLDLEVQALADAHDGDAVQADRARTG